jgi:3-hydroxyacyl-[acyl-carrier-protein] dehydratase
VEEQGSQTLGAIDIQRILDILPHRYPFLLVDRIVEMDGDRSGVGIKNVTANEPQFMGHFPGRPLFPGVLMVEAMAQTAGALVIMGFFKGDGEGKQVLFMTIDKAKFRKPVVPGDQVRLYMTKINHKRNIWWYRGEAKVDGVLVAEAEISAMIISKSDAAKSAAVSSPA